MVDPEDLDRETAQLEDIHIRIHELVFELLIVFFVQGFPDEADRQWCGVYSREIYVLEDMPERSDMVQMAMRDQDSSDILLILDEIGDIRDDVIDAMHAYRSEFKSCIHDKDIVLVFYDGHIDTDLVETSQRDDLDRYLVLLDQCFRILDDRLGLRPMPEERF